MNGKGSHWLSTSLHTGGQAPASTQHQLPLKQCSFFKRQMPAGFPHAALSLSEMSHLEFKRGLMQAFQE
jgi:hypothetical protein